MGGFWVVTFAVAQKQVWPGAARSFEGVPFTPPGSELGADLSESSMFRKTFQFSFLPGKLCFCG